MKVTLNPTRLTAGEEEKEETDPPPLAVGRPCPCISNLKIFNQKNTGAV